MQEGFYPRLNAKMFAAPGDQFGETEGALLSLVGRLDPSSMILHAADGGAVSIIPEEGVAIPHGATVEAIGVLDDPSHGSERRFKVILMLKSLVLRIL